MNVDNLIYTQIVLTGVSILLGLINIVDLAHEVVKLKDQQIKKEKALASGKRRMWIGLIVYIILTYAIAVMNGVPLF